MRFPLVNGLVIGVLAIAPAGCGPNPVVDNSPQQDRIEVDVDTDDDGEVNGDTDAGVDVQVGGGEGVRVDIDPNQPGTDVEVGGDAD